MPEPTPCSCQTNDCGLLVGFDARYDQASNRGYIRHLHCDCRSHLYPTYDSIDRLGEVERGIIAEPGTVFDLPDTIDIAITLPGADESRSYTLDGVSNWDEIEYTRAGTTGPVTEVRSHNALNQITSGGQVYDNNGNLTDDGTHLLAYDAFNRLRQVRRKSDSVLIAEYFYDAMGRRVRKVVGELDDETHERQAVTPSGVSSEVRLAHDSAGRVVEETHTNGSSLYVTTNRFQSEVAVEQTFPDDRVVESVPDDLYRRQRCSDKDADPQIPPIAEWWYYGPGRTMAMQLGNNVLCSHADNELKHSALQGGMDPPEWGDACTDRIGYDGAGRMISKRYISLPTTFAIQILGSAEMTPDYNNRWEYTWKKVVFDGNGGFMDDPDGIDHTTEGYSKAYNTIESNNSLAGVQGSGDNVSWLPTGVRLRPLGVDAVILNAQIVLNCEGKPQVMFTAPNNIDGPCATA